MVTTGGLRGRKTSFLPDMVSKRTRERLKRKHRLAEGCQYLFLKWCSEHAWLFYEKEVRSFDDLVKAVRFLDEDSGIRLIGERNGRGCLVFVTRFGEIYTMMTYSIVRKTGAPGRRMGVVEFDGVDAVAAALRKAAPDRIRGYVY
jgi:hypothetical protein